MKILLSLVLFAGLQESQRGKETWTPLFNGKDLAGWEIHLEDPGADPAKTFRIEEKTIVCLGTPAGYLVTKRPFREFTLKLDWRYRRPADLKDDSKFSGNSGVLLYIQERKVWPRSLEIQGMNRDAGTLIPIDTRGKSQFDRDAQKKAIKAVGEWNSFEIQAKAEKIEVRLNGVLVNTITEFELKEGPIAFQSEGAEIHWRDIQIQARGGLQ